jgi:two-component sensor histidine kinase/integral membrane sensor domain MASE1
VPRGAAVGGPTAHILAEDDQAAENQLAMPEARARPRYVAGLAALALCYFLGARLGLALAFTARQVTAVWPPTGIAVAALVSWGPRVWPALFLGALAANAMAGEALLTAAGIAVGNTAGPVAAAFALRRWGSFSGTFSRVREVLELVLVAALGMTITASNGVLQLALAGLLPWSACPGVWWIWWLGDAMGVLLVAPFLLTWLAEPAPSWSRGRALEAAALFGSLLFLTLEVFSSGVVHLTPASQPMKYAVFPFVIWAALRFGPRETASAILLISVMTVRAAARHRGPLGSNDLNPDEQLLRLELFVAIVAVTGMILAATARERMQAESKLRRANDELETRVRARTAELGASLREKDVLLSEVHHRVKNNLQIVSSLLSLQASRLEDDALRRLFLESQSRIHSIALVHETLYRSNDLGRVNFGTYARTLLHGLGETQSAATRGISLDAHTDEVELSTDVAVTCGLIANELVTNAFKYAFPEGRKGRVEIEVRRSPPSRIVVVVRDDGVGLPEAIDPFTTRSVGLSLVAALARQIDAELEIDRSAGTSFRIAFAAAHGSSDPRELADMT